MTLKSESKKPVQAAASKLRILKTWLSQDQTLIFQCQPLAPGLDLPKKAQLLLDLRQQSFGARFSSEKPADASSNHAFIQILRKHLPQFTIKELLLDPASGNIWIPLLGGAEAREPWHILLTRSRPPLASLIDPQGTVYVSYGQKGTFTKKHKLEAAMPADLEKNLLPELMSSISLSHESVPPPDSEEKEDETRAAAGTELLPEAQRDLISRLKRKQKTLGKSLQKLKAELPAAKHVEAEERRAQLLQSYSYLLKPEDIELSLEAALTGFEEACVISVDPELSKGAQIEAAFHSARRLKRSRTMGLQQIEQLETQLRFLEEDLAFLRAEARSASEWEFLVRKYKLPELAVSSKRGDEPTAKAYKTYLAASGHAILVGKDAQTNDVLAKSARSNDYWLHAVNGTGSHVIIPATADIRQALPTALMREAAILALHFSRFREDLSGECYITRKAHIKKQKGMPAGLWRVNQSETLFFRYSEDELKAILGRLKP